MARTNVPYVVSRTNKNGTCRYYWRPSPDLEALGFEVVRLCADRVFTCDAMIPGDVVEASRPLTHHARAVLAGSAPAPGAPAGGARAGSAGAGILPGSVGAMIAAYRRDEAFTRLAASTRKSYGDNLALIEAWAGDRMPIAITPADCKLLYESLRDGKGKRTASLAIAVLRLLLRWGRSNGFPNTTPASGLKMEGHGGDGRIWSQGAIDAMVAFFDAEGRHSLGTAVLLNGWLGQREADLLGLRRSQYRGGVITLTPSKTSRSTGKRVWLPVDQVPALRERLAREFERQARRDGANLERLDAPVIVNAETGKAYTGNNFRAHISRARRAIGAPALAQWRKARGLDLQGAVSLLNGNGPALWHHSDWKMWELPARPRDWPEGQPFRSIPREALDRLFALDEAAENDPRLELLCALFMHLRHTAITRMAEGGATAQQISSITGHSVKWITQILDIYGVHTRKLAEQAFTLRLAAEGET